MSKIDKYQFSFFLSHSSDDKIEAKLLRDIFTSKGRPCWFDDDLNYGANIGIEVVAGMKNSRRALILLSPSFVESKWANFEVWLHLFNDPMNTLARVVPILLHDCDIPDEIKSLKWVDAREGITDKLADEIITKS